MNERDNTAFIYVRDTLAGRLIRSDEGYSFSYDEAYLRQEHSAPVSLTLPLRPEPYFSKSLFAFFDGLIPEGWLLNAVIHNWKIDPGDRFSLLLAACKDCIGCVSVRSAAKGDGAEK